MKNKLGLNDFDKVAVTVALWLSALSLFASAFSLPMLPEKVSIFQIAEAPSAQSKYYNLILVLMSIIPAVIVLIAASLKRRNRLKNNFVSIILFAVMISLCTGGVMIYGIMQQLEVSKVAYSFNINALIAVLGCFLLSMFAAIIPLIVHSPQYINRKDNVSERKSALITFALSDWAVGAYGYCLGGITVAFTPGAFCYIPLVVFAIAHGIYIGVRVRYIKKGATAAEQKKEK